MSPKPKVNVFFVVMTKIEKFQTVLFGLMLYRAEKKYQKFKYEQLQISEDLFFALYLFPSTGASGPCALRRSKKVFTYL